MSTLTQRNWWTGFSGFWLRECGSANFFIPGFLASIASPLLTLIEDQNIQAFSLVFSISALWMAFCWQLVKLQAQESALLFPAIKQHIYLQGTVILIIGYLLNALALFNRPASEVAYAMLFATSFGGSFFLLCLRNSVYFRHNSYVFMLVLVLAMFFGDTPQILALLAVPLMVMGIYLLVTRTHHCQWHHLAYQTYINNIQTGWLPSNTFAPDFLTQGFRQFFMPMSYFAGNLLIQTCQILLVSGLLAIVASGFFGVTLHFVIGFTDMLVLMVAIFVCWSKLQTKMTWDQLYLLPIYSSLKAIKQAYHVSAVKLAFCLALFQLLVLLACSFFSTFETVAFYLVIFTGSIAGFVLCVALGSMIKSALTLSLSCMFVVILHSAFKSYLLNHEQSATTLYLLLGYVVIATSLLVYSNKKFD
ncbi:hypothetical protein [Pseudoalteromonas piscicida]|uniref:hypothetical protein n=1 Tax=Pseudoalteromonas piscicida TaxID=43662 RepID=UPI0027E40C3F|nr:hypothetical protein [Pseudoalteromonas piscicida]WMO13328.1 hypothetical protein NI376_14895 [Pseudoalteromonas piscicida]